AAQEGSGELRATFEQVFGVIEEYEQVPLSKLLDQALCGRGIPVPAWCDDVSDAIRDEVRVRERRELDEPRAVWECVGGGVREPERATRLANPTAPDEAAQLTGQVVVGRGPRVSKLRVLHGRRRLFVGCSRLKW